MFFPLAFLLTLSSAVFAASLPRHAEAELLHISTVDHGLDVRDTQCTNTAATRQCWTNGTSIATNYDAVWPTTGKVVSYNLEVQNLTLAPDGVRRTVYAINGQFPGPVIRASWGDTLQITVKNSLTTNGTSIHWHGIRQWQSTTMDGTNGITECPLAPGQSRTYTFLCTQFGTTWYHSHYSDQYSDGVVGTMIIDGPTTSNYDIDLGTYPITDWFYTPVFTVAPLVQAGIIRPPPADNVLINGTNVNLVNGTGNYARTTLTKGKKHKLRLINTSTNDNYQVFLDGHTFTVVTTDFTPIVPYTTKYIFIGIGQRYDVIINADQAVDSYWFHAVPQTGCSANKNSNARSIFTYSGASSTMPSNATASNLPPTTTCFDAAGQFVPYVKLDVPSNYTFPSSSNLTVGFAITQNTANQTQVQWNLNSTAIVADWNNPTLKYVQSGSTNFPKQANIITLPNKNQWSYWIVQTVTTLAPAQSHPMHLHGHDFYVLGSGNGIFSSNSTLQYKNPPRRDVAMLPAGGWLVVAFITDNPGAWLFHCHLAFHISLGLGAQFLERYSDITPIINSTPGWNDQCTAWNKYSQTAIFKEDDSGL